MGEPARPAEPPILLSGPSASPSSFFKLCIRYASCGCPRGCPRRRRRVRALSLGSDGEAALPGAGPTLGAGSGATDDQWGRRPAAPRAPLVAPLEIKWRRTLKRQGAYICIVLWSFPRWLMLPSVRTPLPRAVAGGASLRRSTARALGPCREEGVSRPTGRAPPVGPASRGELRPRPLGPVSF